MTLAIQYDETVAPLIKSYWTQMKGESPVGVSVSIQLADDHNRRSRRHTPRDHTKGSTVLRSWSLRS